MCGRFEDKVYNITQKWEQRTEYILHSGGVVINDPIHGSVKLNGLEASILDLPPVQRLREIRQLGAASVLYPAANHTRFEHTVGTYYVTSKLLREIDHPDHIDEVQKQEVKIAAILHDIGHLPFSHPTEPLVSLELEEVIEDDDEFNYEGVHEYIGWKLLGSDYMTDIIEHISQHYAAAGINCDGISLERIRSMIVGDYRDPSDEYDERGCQYLADIISGPIDADRLDYLQRESHKVGFPSFVDTPRLYPNLIVLEHPVKEDEMRLGINEKAVEAAKSLIIARDRIIQIVHDHHVTTIAEDIMLRKIREVYDSPVELIGETDYELFAKLLEGSDIWRFRGRNLPKRFMYYSPSDEYYKNTKSSHIRSQFQDVFSDLEDRIGFENRLKEDTSLSGTVIVNNYNGPVSVTPSIQFSEDAERMPVRGSSDKQIKMLRVYMGRRYENEPSTQRPQIRVFASWENMQSQNEELTNAVKVQVAEKLEINIEYLTSDYEQSRYQNILDD